MFILIRLYYTKIVKMYEKKKWKANTQKNTKALNLSSQHSVKAVQLNY